MWKKPTLSKSRKRTKQSLALRAFWKSKKAIEMNCKQNSPHEPQGDIIQADANVVNFMHDYCATSTISTYDTLPSHEVIVDPWDPSNEHDSIMEHKLDVVNDKSEEPNTAVTGNRVVNIGYLLKNTLKVQYDHAKKCTFGRLTIHNEKRFGLFSSFTLKCTFCHKYFGVTSEETVDPANNAMLATVNVLYVWGTLANGSTYSQTKDLMSALDIPCMIYSTFQAVEDSLADHWKDTLWKSMKMAGEEESKLAIKNKQVCDDGTPWIYVCTDGGWSKRSYGHSYNALSGAAVVIGKETGKVLFLGIRNKYCCICAHARNRNIVPAKHKCFKNWESSSTAMEADIIVEAFNSSISMHGLKYLKIIADGDSSVYSRIRNDVSYGAEVEKLECVNHIIKNYGKALYNIKKSTNVPFAARKVLTHEKIKKLQQIIMSVAKTNENVEDLKNDVTNSIYHIYGDHLNCSSRYCNVIGHLDAIQKTRFLESSLLFHLNGALEPLLSKAHKLIAYENNNKAESFMSLLAKYNCGKRLNLIQRRSFETRSYLAALQYNTGPQWQSDAIKEVLNVSPGEYFIKRLKHLEEVRNRNQKHGRKRKRDISHTDEEYGPNAAQALLSEEELKSEYRRITKSLQVTQEQQWQLAVATIGQFDNDLYRKERARRLTASNFGSVIKRKESTSCTSLLKKMLYSNFTNAAMEYGKRCEKLAKRKVEELLQVPVHDAGLFVDIDHGYLAASPDGLIGEDATIEIKCAYSLHQKKQTVEEAIRTTKTFYLKLNEHGTPTLKENHNYFYQIQGQLNITKRSFCYFVVYINDDLPMFIQKIYRNEHLWKKKMLPKLESFFYRCFLPEQIQQYIKKNIPCKHELMNL